MKLIVGTSSLALGAAFAITATLVSVRAPVHADAQLPESLTLTGALSVTDRGIVERAFDVPPGTTQFDLVLTGLDSEGDPADFGIRGPGGIRGWSTARHDPVHVDATSASLGYLPGPVEPGEWHVMLGAPDEVADRPRPYTITVQLSGESIRARPVVREGGGWFAGDLHVHSGHSDGYHADARGRLVPVTVQSLATGAVAAGLDFLAVTDHNTASHWIDVDRAQAAHADLLLLHGREITTARGHFNAIGEQRFTDFRLGPARPMARLIADVARDGAFVSINHAWLTSDGWCGGCRWVDRNRLTLLDVAGIEIVNGSTPTPGDELPGWQWWAELLNRGERLTAVAGSDVHDPIGGSATIGAVSTVVWAAALSEDAIVAGLRSGRAFVRAVPDPHLFVDLRATDGRVAVEMGEAIRPGLVTLTARILGAAGQQCVWIRRGRAVRSIDLTDNDRSETFTVEAAPDDWFSVVVRRDRQAILLSNAVYVSGSTSDEHRQDEHGKREH